MSSEMEHSNWFVRADRRVDLPNQQTYPTLCKAQFRFAHAMAGKGEAISAFRLLLLPFQNPNPSLIHRHSRGSPACLQSIRSLWSMKKEPALEKALSRNRRWIVNNQIKNILLRAPGRVASVRSLQKKFKSLDLRGRALNWLHKYPCCFETFPDRSGETLYGFSKRMTALVDEEEVAREAAEADITIRLAKILMLARDHKLNVLKLNELKRSFGLPDDYLLRIVLERSDLFRVVSGSGKRKSMEIELAIWNADLAVSAVEAMAEERGTLPQFLCSLPPTWIQTRAKFDEFNQSSSYPSPYSTEQIYSEKRAVAMIHELLSLTLWKKLSIVKLGHFRREFCLPEKLGNLLLRHPCIFYVSNRYKIYTVLLREGYDGSELREKHPLVMAKERLGELMQEGLYEYNRRRQLVNLEKRKKKGEIRPSKQRKQEDENVDQISIYQPEERRRFYNALFDDPPP